MEIREISINFAATTGNRPDVFWVTLANPLTYAKNDKYLINEFPGKDKKAIFGSGFDLLHLNYGQKSYSIKPKYRTSEYAWFSLFI